MPKWEAIMLPATLETMAADLRSALDPVAFAVGRLEFTPDAVFARSCAYRPAIAWSIEELVHRHRRMIHPN